VTALVIVFGSLHNTSMAKTKRKPMTPDPASFAFGVMQHVVEATGDKPDEPKPAQDQSGKSSRLMAGSWG
jgi:hypothetical protein